MKVKILYASYPDSLENDINHWMYNNRRARVIDIKFATSDKDMTMYRFCAMILYEE